MLIGGKGFAQDKTVTTADGRQCVPCIPKELRKTCEAYKQQAGKFTSAQFIVKQCQQTAKERKDALDDARKHNATQITLNKIQTDQIKALKDRPKWIDGVWAGVSIASCVLFAVAIVDGKSAWVSVTSGAGCVVGAGVMVLD